MALASDAQRQPARESAPPPPGRPAFPRAGNASEPNTISERAVVLDVCWPEVSDDARSERRLSPPVMKPEYATSKGSARLP